MINEAWYDFFLESLHKRYSKKTVLVQALIDLLCLEREAVYRRLRKEVLFPVNEIVKIADAWNISLDEMTSIHAGNVSFMMKPINYFDPSENEEVEVKRRVQRLEHIKDSDTSECMEVCNKLPRSLITGYPLLYRFDMFRWAYQYGNRDETPTFASTTIPPFIEENLLEYYQLIKHMSNMSYIWNHRMFEYLVSDIQYFHSIFLITDEDKELIKHELLRLLDYWLEVATKGYFPETKKRVNIYISKVHIDTNYSYFYTEDLKMCRVYAFDKYDFFSYNAEMVDNFRTWMRMKKRTSIQISEVDEKSRLDFFNKQREMVNTL